MNRSQKDVLCHSHHGFLHWQWCRSLVDHFRHLKVLHCACGQQVLSGPCDMIRRKEDLKMDVSYSQSVFSSGLSADNRKSRGSSESHLTGLSMERNSMAR